MFYKLIEFYAWAVRSGAPLGIIWDTPPGIALPDPNPGGTGGTGGTGVPEPAAMLLFLGTGLLGLFNPKNAIETIIMLELIVISGVALNVFKTEMLQHVYFKNIQSALLIALLLRILIIPTAFFGLRDNLFLKLKIKFLKTKKGLQF